MRTIPLLLIILVVATLFVSKTLTVQVHPANIANVGRWVASVASNNAIGEQLRAQVFKLRRQGESKLFNSKDQKVDIALSNAKKDLEHLNEIADKTSDLDILKPSVELLLESLNSLTASTKDITVDRLATLKPDMAKVFADADTAFEVMKSKGVSVDEFKTKLAGAVTDIEAYIGKLGQVAGAEDDKAKDSPTPVPQREEPAFSIPLKF
ncbi:MAG: hypothetical protein HYZ63_01955 [Candidatus Andersenbacteria bacterium]|nr:hypothetical protein [Candidatus Andersenbacteria bacterium]